jgi:uncharacterized protein
MKTIDKRRLRSEFGILEPMRFTQDATSGINLIRGYAPGELRINAQHFDTSLIVTATELLPEPALRGVSDLSDDLAARVLALKPEVVLIGTGATQSFAAAGFGVKFLRAGIGYEVMTTAAACRTFNVLVAEQRRALAILIV